MYRSPAYITWERYEANQQRLLRDTCVAALWGCPCNGKAINQPAVLVVCGRRGCQLSE